MRENMPPENVWSTVEGMVVAGSLDPYALAKFFQDQSVVAQMDWYEASPGLVGLKVVTDGTHVGRLTPKAQTLKVGETIADLAKRIAEKFGAEVLLGDTNADSFQGEPPAVENLIEEEPSEQDPLRLVEISSTPASAVPLLAAFEGVDIAQLDLLDGNKVLLTQIPAGRSGWVLGELPLVALTMRGEEFQASLLEEGDPEESTNYNWGMEELVVLGGRGWENQDAPDEVRHLVDGYQDMERIVSQLGQGSVSKALAATKERGPQAVTDLVSALALPTDVAQFLLGRITVEQVAGAKVHYARGVSNAIGRSVDILIEDRQHQSKYWQAYTKLVTTKPWLVPLVASAESLVGLLLIGASRAKNGKRSGLRKLGTLAGVALLVDSIGEVTLAKYTRWREQRNQSLEEG